MRKSHLRQQVDNFCRHDHSGSNRSRKHRHFVLHKMIRDLFHIGSVPLKWHAITRDDIHRLVIHWQKENIKPSTIMKYMRVIRDFFQKIEHIIPEISNKNLGITKQKRPAKTVHFSKDFLDKLSNPIAKILLEFQIYFGLTLSEAMRLSPDVHIQEHSVWITRDIATNSLDRMIPIRTNEQLEITKSFLILCSEQNLISTFGYHPVRHAYNTELKVRGLPSSKSYRCLYAKNIHSELIKVLSAYLSKQTIMREMGLQSRRTLWAYLNV
ncbi:MAG: hypothetical protein H0T84_08670 [Tatlockia sp.]|nr:hypothetical protein [Tatlockia sp.]